MADVFLDVELDVGDISSKIDKIFNKEYKIKATMDLSSIESEIKKISDMKIELNNVSINGASLVSDITKSMEKAQSKTKKSGKSGSGSVGEEAAKMENALSMAEKRLKSFRDSFVKLDTK